MTEREWMDCTNSGPMLEFLRTNVKANDRKFLLFACACVREIWSSLNDERSRSAVEFVEQVIEDTVTPEMKEIIADEAWCAPRGFDDSASWAAAYLAATFFIPVPKAAWVVAQSAASAKASELGRLNSRHASYVAFDIAKSEVEGYGQEVIPWAEHVSDCNTGTKEEATLQGLRTQADLLRDLLGPLPFHHIFFDPSVLTWKDNTVVRLAQAAYEERIMPEGTLDRARLAILADALEDAGCSDVKIVGHLRGPGPHVRGCWAVDLILGKT